MYTHCRPEKGSQSECRALIASLEIYKEMTELCNIIDQCGERLFTEEEKPNDPRKAIAFGTLFNVITNEVASKLIFLLNTLLFLQIFTAISDKLVGMLLRARKHKLVDFEGEVLFQVS